MTFLILHVQNNPKNQADKRKQNWTLTHPHVYLGLVDPLTVFHL